MVIKKPYAFLIKHFRLIHGLLFIMLLFLAVKTLDIYNFFNAYASEHTFINQANLASNYVNISMYAVSILAILVLFVIYFILSMKDKGNRIYFISILYYIVLLIFFIYIYSVFNGLQNNKTLDLETIRMLRDIALIILLPQVIVLFIIFGRTLGFNIKQFEFKKDLEELQIDTSDNEEVELTLGNDTYKIARFFRKFLRLSKYFLLENKLFVIASSSLVIFALCVLVYSKINVYQESYNESEDIQASALWFKVNESYLTTTDVNNVVISKGKHYVLVNLNVTNNNGIDYDLNRDTFRLKAGNELLIPIFSVKDKFYDLGNVFKPEKIYKDSSVDYLVIFEVKDEYKSKDYLFRIKNYSFENNKTVSTYKDIIVKPTNLNDSVDKGNFKLPNKVDLSDSLLKNSVLEIDSVDMAYSFKEKYKYTINNQEKEAIYSIIPSDMNKSSVILIKIKSRLKVDDSIYLKNVIQTPADLYDLYGIISYRYQGNYHSVKLNKLNVNYDIQNYSYLEIPKEVEKANRIDLIILIRGVKYTFNLK